MVRFYCLTSFKQIPAISALDDIQSMEVDNYISNYYGNNTTRIMEMIKNVSEKFNAYQLTEISIGYSLNNQTKKRIFLMLIYRKDIGLIVLPMIPGAVKFHSVSNVLHEFVVASSKLYSNIMHFDLQIKVRCIKNTQIRGSISKEEQKCYENYVKQIEIFCNNNKDLQETAFEKLTFILPNLSKPNVLRQKISDITTVVRLLCDPKTGSIANINPKARYNQKVKCSMLEQKVSTKTLGQAKCPQPYLEAFKNCDDDDVESDHETLLPTHTKNIGTYYSTSSASSKNTSGEEDLNFSHLKKQSITTLKRSLEIHNANCGSKWNFILKEFEKATQRIIDSIQSISIYLKKDFEENFKNLENKKNLNKICSTAVEKDKLFHGFKYGSEESSKTTFSASSIHDKSNKYSGKQFLKYIQNTFYDLKNAKNQLLLVAQRMIKAVGIIENFNSAENGNAERPMKLPRTIHLNNFRECREIHIDNVNFSSYDIFSTASDYANMEKLVFRNCNITELPNLDILPLSITSLDLSYNRLTFIPDSISRLSNLAVFIVSGNPLDDNGIPWSYLPKSIIHLNINKIHITCIPPMIQRLDKLKYLKVGNKNLKSITWENISDTLEELVINDSEINFIGPISHLSNLSSLKANLNQIKYISGTTIDFHALTEVEFKNNDLYFLPNGFENLNSLKYLNLSKNKFWLEKMDERLWKRLPPNLDSLILNGNKLQELPCQMHTCNLTYLAAVSCSLEYICPRFITKPGKNEFVLEIADNPRLSNLPFIPKIIYPKISTTDYIINPPITYINILTDNENFVFSPTSETIYYKFEYCKEIDHGCKRCACCGNQTTEKMIEQIMIMDFNLCLLKTKADLNVFSFDTSISDKHEDTIHANREKLSQRVDHVFSPGQWKTNVKTRLCTICLRNIKEQINTTQELYQRLQGFNKIDFNSESSTMPVLIPQTTTCYESDLYQLVKRKHSFDSTQKGFRNKQSDQIKHESHIFHITKKNAIVDEVDNMLLDGYNLVEQLSSSTPSNSQQIKSESSTSQHYRSCFYETNTDAEIRRMESQIEEVRRQIDDQNKLMEIYSSLDTCYY